MLTLDNLHSVSWQCVHFSSEEHLPSDLNSDLFLSVQIDGKAATTEGLLQAVAEALQFPDYFGGNWDALEECLRDLEWLPARGYVLIVTHGDVLWRMNPQIAGALIESWLLAAEEWAQQSIPFHLVFLF